MPCSLHLLFSDALPTQEGEEVQVLMVQTDGELLADGVQRTGDCAYVTTVLANYDDLALLYEEVGEWWREASGVEPTLELLTSDVTLMSDETRRSARELPIGCWNLSAFVGFDPRSESAKNEARVLIMESCMKVQ